MTAASPIRAGFVIDTLRPGAGTENQLILLLRSLDRTRVVPHLCCLYDNPELAGLELGCTKQVLGFNHFLSLEGLGGFRAFRRWAVRERLDLVTTFFRDGNMLGTLGARSVGLPLVSNRRNLGRGYWHNGWELWKLRRLNRLATRFVANSHAVQRYTAEAEGVDPARIEVIHNAVDSERFRPADPQNRGKRREALGLPTEAFVVGCVANLRPIKAIDQLIRAFAAARRELPDPLLLLVGEGPLEPVLRRLASELGVTDAVRFLGARQDTEIVMSCFDVGVLPSRAESFSNALLEYLACGLPTVATDVGGNGELLAGGAHGVLVPPDEPEALHRAVVELARCRDTRRRLGAAAREYVQERFTLPRILEAWYRCFESVARGRAVG